MLRPCLGPTGPAEKKLIFGADRPCRLVLPQFTMSAPIVQAASFSVSNMNIAAPKVIKDTAGAKQAYVSYNENQLMMQTPCLRLPFAVNSGFKDKNGKLAGPEKYTFNLALNGYQDNPKIKAFYDVLVAMDKYMIDQGVKNSKLWLGSTMSRELVAHSYSPCIKQGKEKDGVTYPPTFKIGLGKDPKTNQFRCDFWRKTEDGKVEQYKDTPVENILVRRAEVTCIIQCTGVWFAAGKFGLSWKAKQVRVDKVSEGISGYGFQDEEEMMDDAEEFGGAAPSKPMIADDSEDEEEETVSHTPAPAPAPASKQQVVDSDEEEETVSQQPAITKKPSTISKRKAIGTAKGK